VRRRVKGFGRVLGKEGEVVQGLREGREGGRVGAREE